MKKFTFILACLTAFATAASTAFVVPPALESARQVSICSILAVDVKTAASGIRSYTELVETTKLHQPGDLITVAATIEVKNRAKYKTLTSIAGHDIDLEVSSSTADLSSANISPVVLSAVLASDLWGSTSNVATVATRVTSGSLKYDRSTGKLKLHMVGAEDEGTLEGNLQMYMAREGVDKNGKAAVFIPAINAADYSTPYGLYSAPYAVQYTLVVSALAKPAARGELSARLMTQSAESFYDASDKLYAKFYGGEKPDASIRVLNIGEQYTIARFYDDAKKGRTGLSARLEALGWPLGERADKLAYRNEKGTLELWMIFKYDTNAVNGVDADDFVIGMINEHSEDPTAKPRGIGLTEFDASHEVQRYNSGVYNSKPAAATATDISVYANNSGKRTPTGMSARDIDNALSFFGFDVGIGTGGAVTEDACEVKGAKPLYSESVTSHYSYGKATIIEDIVDEGTEEEIIDDENEDENEDEIPDEEFIDEEVIQKVPSTGDAGVSAAFAAALLTAGAAAAALLLKKRLSQKH